MRHYRECLYKEIISLALKLDVNESGSPHICLSKLSTTKTQARALGPFPFYIVLLQANQSWYLSTVLLSRGCTGGNLISQCQSNWIRAWVYSSSCSKACKYEKNYLTVQNISKWKDHAGFTLLTDHRFP